MPILTNAADRRDQATFDMIQGLLREASQELDMVHSGDHERALTLIRQAAARLDSELQNREESK